MVPDRTGRFDQRPHYEPSELDRECDTVIRKFLSERHGEVRFPITTDDLTVLIEREARELDQYADLSEYGDAVEGVTLFEPGEKPLVKIAAELSEDERRENRLRTTLTHEWGHVHYHAYLWDMVDHATGDLFGQANKAHGNICKRESMLNAPYTDWMEWQAGYVCGALLMPVSAMTELVRDYLQTAGLQAPLAGNSKHVPKLIDAVVKTFAVSREAARIRLIKLKFLSDAEAGETLFSR